MATPDSHVLVGGLGFIGGNLALSLLDTGLRVVVIARPSSIKKRGSLAKSLEKSGVLVRVSGGPSITREDILESNPAVIYYLAGKPSGSWKSQYEAHVSLAKIAADIVNELGIRMVYTSSIAVSADTASKPKGSIIVEDDAPPGIQGSFTTIHAETKALGERIIINTVSNKRWSIIRPALVYGPRAQHGEHRLLKSLARMRVMPSLPGLPVVNVLDLAHIMIMAGEGAFDSKMIHGVARNYTFSNIAQIACQGRCISLPLQWILRLGRIAPKSSKIRLAWSIIRRSYRYESRVLTGYPWRLEPVF